MSICAVDGQVEYPSHIESTMCDGDFAEGAHPQWPPEI